jgi:hypothetical protein
LPQLPCGRDGFANALDGNQRLLHDERRFEMQDAITQANKFSIAALVSGNAPMMPEAVDFEVMSTLPRKPTAAAWSINGIPCLGKSSSYAVS